MPKLVDRYEMLALEPAKGRKDDAERLDRQAVDAGSSFGAGRDLRERVGTAVESGLMSVDSHLMKGLTKPLYGGWW